MSPTPPSTTSSSAGAHSPDAQYRVVRKRNRVPLSCAPCRHRKLKCNRTSPCENCIRRGDASSCSYAAPSTRKKNQTQGSTSPDDMQIRIDRLEGLVLSLMTNGAQSAGPAAAAAAISRSTSISDAPSIKALDQEDDDDMIKEEDEGSDDDPLTNSFGAMKVDCAGLKTTYFGDSHWHLVLADITEVKNYFASHKRELEQHYNKTESASAAAKFGGPAFLFSVHNPSTEAELRSGLPAKPVVERLVSRYLNSLDASVYTIHCPTFNKEMQKHFQDPTSTSISWLGLLYAILCLAMQSYHKIGDEPTEYKGRTLQLAQAYRLRTVQCLVVSDYTKSVDNTIETLILYLHGEQHIRNDTDVGLWVVTAMIVRLAMRCGYHRDPKYFTGISAFQGEMRRRAWSFIRMCDILLSFQLALPNMIRVGDCDTELPRNIFDDEFDPGTKELPPSRPKTEPTPLSYMLAKAELSLVFGEIIEEINSLSGHKAPYDEVMKKDAKLRQVQSNIPTHLKVRPLEDCIHDPVPLILSRFIVDFLYQKALCVLHRKYLSRARQNPRYAHSRRTCVEASMEMLRHQDVLHRETQFGGRLRPMRSLIGSFTKNDILLGSMIVCLDLHCDSVSEKSQTHFWTADQRADMFHALEKSAEIWKECEDTSIEAYKASNVLGVMLEKLKRQGFGKSTTTMEPRTTNEGFSSFDDDLQPERSAAMTLGMLSSGGLTPNSTALFGNSLPLTPGATNKYTNVDMNLGDTTTGLGLTPNFGMGINFPGTVDSSLGSFSQVLGNMSTGSGMGDFSQNLDWEAWDSYIQNGNSLDPSLQFYPGSFDSPSTAEMQGDINGFGSNVFMNTNTQGGS